MARVFYGWWVMVASVIGTALCASPVVFLTLGLFMIPIEQDLGWNRAQISLALSVAALALAGAIPLVGWILDRFGPRRVLLTSIPLYGIAISSLYLTGASLWYFYLIFAAIGVLGAGCNTITYARLLTAWFDRRRGLALGAAMAGVPIGKVAALVVAQALIELFDWRTAYAGLALMVLLIGVPMAALVIRDTPAEMGLRPDGADAAPAGARREQTAAAPAAGWSRQQAFRSRVFWILMSVFFMLAVAIHGIQIHLVPLLRDAGIDARWAAAAAGMAAVTSACGRVVVGFLFDRFFAPRVAIVAFLCSATGFVLLDFSDSIPLAFACAVLIGIGASAESDLLAYLTGRYFGLASFGELYGYVFAAFMVGTAIGPYLVGVGYELAGSYGTTLWICFAGTLVVCLLLASLGPFPDWSAEERGEPALAGRG
jgi:MFS family permease